MKLEHITYDTLHSVSLPRFDYSREEDAAHLELTEPSVHKSVREVFPDVFVYDIWTLTTYHDTYASTTIFEGRIPLIYMATGHPHHRRDVVARVQQTSLNLGLPTIDLELQDQNDALCIVRFSPAFYMFALRGTSDSPNIGNLERRMAWPILDRLAGKEVA